MSQNLNSGKTAPRRESSLNTRSWILALFLAIFYALCPFSAGASENASDSGYAITSDLWIRAVISTEEKGPVEALWQQGGRDTTAEGHEVIWGYFYANPSDVAWGSQDNPDAFVKIWFDASGRLDVNFFHVSVPDIVVYSNYEGASTNGVISTSRRYIRQWYENGQASMDETYEDGLPAQGYTPAGNPSGYSAINGLRIGAVINTVDGAIDAGWHKGGEAVTADGSEVFWGHFYANPSDVTWGSENNPDLFVKVWFDASGRVDVNFFHVSVPDIEVFSDFPDNGDYDEKGTTIVDDRYIRHEYQTDGSENTTPTLCINEFMASNSSTLSDPQGEYEDWIEIYNSGEDSLSLSGMYLSDDPAEPTKWQFPDISLNPGAFLIVWTDGDTDADGLHADFKLSGSGESILFSNADQKVIDTLTFESQTEDISFGRYPDGSDNWGFMNPTPGLANTDIIQNAETERPDGWTDETHGDSADPNYDIVFPGDAVRKIELVIDPADWQAMLDDMTDIYGESGSEGGQFDGGDWPDDEIPDDGMGGGERPDDGMNGQMPDDGMGGGERPDGGMGDQMPDGDMDGGNLELADSNPVWKPCTFLFEDKVWNHVGVRFKGNSSLSSTWKSGILKLPFRFDFDQFEDDYPEIDNQRFYGFKKLSLSSNYADDSLIREKVAADIFRDAGIPAAKTAFYRVYIDHGEGSQYFGLYTMVEVPAEPMLERCFQNSDGNLYKPTSNFATFDESKFDKENNEDEADWSDVGALFDTLHSSRDSASAWRASLEEILNVEQFLRWLAVNTLIQNWDTYGVMAHNYYLYTNSEDGRINWIPWDNNMSLMGADSGGMGEGKMGQALSFSLAEVSDNWPLIRYLADDPTYWAKYVSFVRDAAEETFTPERMQPIYKAAHDLIRPYVVGDEGEEQGYTLLGNPEDFDTALDYLNTHVESRQNEATVFLLEDQRK